VEDSFHWGCYREKVKEGIIKDNYIPKPNEAFNTALPDKRWDEKHILQEMDTYDNVLGSQDIFLGECIMGHQN